MTRVSAFVGALTFLLPSAAQACYVCMSGREDDVQLAFILTTVLLSLLPLGLIGGAVWWLRRRLREMERDAPRRPLAAAGAKRSA